MKQLILTILTGIILAACSGEAKPTPTAGLPAAGSHPPVILRVEERQEIKEGDVLVHEDIYFTDPDGDVVKLVNRVVKSSVQFSVSDDVVTASPASQKGEALVTATYSFGVKAELEIEERLLDRAGNYSEPVILSISASPPPVKTDISTMLSNGLFLIILIGLVLLVEFWLLFRRRPGDRLPALRSTLLLFCLLFPLYLLFLFFHEGGHALSNLIAGSRVDLFFVHPFSFSGYSMLPFDWNNAWFHLAGPLLVLLASLIISMLFWKRRVISSLPLVMLFPWAWILQGYRMMLLTIEGGDFRNVVQITGLPASLFIVLGVVIFCIGVFIFLSLFPLLGLAVRDRKAFFVLPAGIFVWCAIGIIAVFALLPGTSADIQYGLLADILMAAESFLIYGVIIGLLLAVIYRTLFSKLASRLPASLQNAVMEVSWKDLRLPALLAVLCVIAGVFLIT